MHRWRPRGFVVTGPPSPGASSAFTAGSADLSAPLPHASDPVRHARRGARLAGPAALAGGGVSRLPVCGAVADRGAPHPCELASPRWAWHRDLLATGAVSGISLAGMYVGLLAGICMGVLLALPVTDPALAFLLLMYAGIAASTYRLGRRLWRATGATPAPRGRCLSGLSVPPGSLMT